MYTERAMATGNEEVICHLEELTGLLVDRDSGDLLPHDQVIRDPQRQTRPDLSYFIVFAEDEAEGANTNSDELSPSDQAPANESREAEIQKLANAQNADNTARCPLLAQDLARQSKRKRR